MSEHDPTSIVVADDHAVMRRGLCLLLEREAGFEVVAEAGDAPATMRKVRAHRPDVLLLDLQMPGGPMIDHIPALLEASSGTGIVVLTMQSSPAYAREALGAGALGYVTKEAADAELVQAIDRAASHQSYISPELGVRLAREPEAADERLTPREREVLTLLALGHTNPEVAEELVISVRTVESHRFHVQQKLGAGSRAELVRYAIDRGLLDA